MEQYTGVINILKPPGMTSSNAVSDVRRIFNVKRVGHTGTLDPGAAGVLPICIGRATRLFDILVDKQKEYYAEIAFGSCTDTQDSYGSIIDTSSAYIDKEMLLSVLPSFLGLQKQIAPKYSALKSEGRALYELAREGKEVPERVRSVEISELICEAQIAQNRYLLRVSCSRGTYVRTLCEDIGKRLGVCAHMSFLLRSKSGGFHVEDSYSIAELAALKEEGRLAEALISVENTIAFLPEIHVSATEAQRLLYGSCMDYKGEDMALCRVYGTQFIGIGVVLNNQLKLKMQF